MFEFCRPGHMLTHMVTHTLTHMVTHSNTHSNTHEVLVYSSLIAHSFNCFLYSNTFVITLNTVIIINIKLYMH